MATYLFRLISLGIHDADETAFGVAESSFSARDVLCEGFPTIAMDQEVLENPTVLQSGTGPSFIPYLGVKSKSKMTFSVGLRGTGTAADGIAAKGYADLGESQILRNAFGAESLGTGSTISDAGPTATEIDVTSGAGFSIGQAVLVPIGSSYEATVLGNVATNTLTFTRALSAAPENAAKVYASATYYLVPGTVGHSLQFLSTNAMGDSANLLGCQLNPKIANLNPNQRPVLNLETFISSWAIGATAMAEDSYDNSTLVPVAGYASDAFFQDFGTTTSNSVDPATISLDPGITIEPYPSPSGVQGVANWVRSKASPILEIVVPYSDTYRDQFEARTPSKYFHYQLGTTPGQVVLIEMQKCFYAKKPEVVEVAGNACHKLTLAGQYNTAGTTDLLRSPLRIHLL